MFNPNSNKLSNNDKFILLLFLTIIIFILYTIRLYDLQIVQGDKYDNQSIRNFLSVKEIPASRGEIFDRNANSPLVINTDSFAVSVIPGNIPKDRYDTVIAKLAGYLGMTKAEVDKEIKRRKGYSSYQIKSNVSFSVISNLAENKYDLPGVTWESKPIRTYTHTQSLTHIIGYVGMIGEDEYTMLKNKGYTHQSVIGKMGIEKQYDLLLQGKPGREIYTRNVQGKIISDKPEIEPPIMGNSLVLTIDSDIQKLMEESLGPRVGASVVLRPATGEILGMVSYPFYDNNIYNADNKNAELARLDNDPNKPYINRAVQQKYPPASTFKIIMSTAMLQENAFPSSKAIVCKGRLVYGGQPFRCHLRSGHGWLDMKNAMAQSCDVYYWIIGRDNLGIEKIASYAQEFGFGQSAQIDLPSQETGHVPTPKWLFSSEKRTWRGGDTMNASIGQGYMEATPLQLANMVAMVSNEGTIYKPHLLKEVRNSATGEVISTFEPEILTQSTIDKSVWKEVQEAMRYTTTDGTPQLIMDLKSVKVACKTGTAEVYPYTNSWHSWLVAYAPYDAPPEERICVATIVEACNDWEWWAPYATAEIIQGIFAHQTWEEARQTLKFPIERKSTYRTE
ncbi:MAG: penicillin-binding protein 2 [Treponema sp.]|nr:penicillin-binding protein 2 [Treponema sp.]